MVRIRFLCDRPTSLELARNLTCKELREVIFGGSVIGSRSIMMLQCGAELKDIAVPSHDLDIFVLMRPTCSAAAGTGSCIPTTSVTFKEPGKPAFQLELPLDSSLKSVKKALFSATRPSRQGDNTYGGREHHQCCQQ
ncbi:unnamed protein product, partial [Pylaiella littoralis]